MNNKLLLIFLLIFPLNLLNSQTGTYCLQEAFMSSCYTFFPNNKFEYKEDLCTATIIGRGKYKIINESITFHYQPIDTIPNDFYKVKKGVETFRIVEKIGDKISLGTNSDSYLLDYQRTEKDATKSINYAFPSYFEQAFQNSFELLEEKKQYTFTSINIGQLKVTSGKIIACDPIVLHDAIPYKYDFPKGAFPVEIAMSKVNGKSQRNALVRIIFTKNKIHKWEFALDETQEYLPIDSGKFYGYPVDGATGLYIDKQGADYLNKLDPEDYFAEIFTNGLKVGPVNTPSFSLYEFKEFNLARFDSGYGDGFYAVYIGLDKDGNICQLLTDFGIISWWEK